MGCLRYEGVVPWGRGVSRVWGSMGAWRRRAVGARGRGGAGPCGRRAVGAWGAGPWGHGAVGCL